jgi:hypothetical protein
MPMKISSTLKAALPKPIERTLALLCGKASITNFNPSYHHDSLATNHWLSTDARFNTAYQKAVDMGLAVDPHIEWRAHVVCWAASVGAKLEGSFVECGVNRGFLSRIIIDYLGNTPDFFLLDTYQGFDPRYLSKAQADGLKAWHKASGRPGKWQQGMYDDCYDDVVQTFSDSPQVKIVKGTVPDTLPQVVADRIAFLSLDMNCAEPEIAALEYFWPKMLSGAYVVMDDYGHPGHEEQRDAFDKFSYDHGVPLMSLPTGQGMLVKN